MKWLRTKRMVKDRREENFKGIIWVIKKEGHRFKYNVCCKITYKMLYEDKKMKEDDKNVKWRKISRLCYPKRKEKKLN